MATINGTTDDDFLTGTIEPENINGFDGNDTLDGGVDNYYYDIVRRGNGEDAIFVRDKIFAFGDGGSDQFIVEINPGHDTDYGDDGVDEALYIVDFSSATEGEIIDISSLGVSDFETISLISYYVVGEASTL